MWDRGTWEPHATDDPAAAIDAGEFHADLDGDKLRGRFILVRTGGPGSNQWLLVHKHDEYAVKGWDPEDYPRSVLSGRTNDEVKADPERVWRSDLPPSEASVAVRRPPEPLSGRQDSPAPGPGPDELAALDALGSGGTWEVFGRRLRLTNLDKVLFPARADEAPVTKRELVRYTALIAPVALPYLTHRALNMHRFPGGADTKGFWHKQLPDHAPEWLPRWDDPHAEPGKTTTYLVVDEPAALVWAANFGALEWHAWTARTDHPDRPTYALIDIDPGSETSWDQVLVLARLHRTALEHLGVRGQPKLTGGRGIHIWIPIAPGPSFEETRAWVEQLSRAIGAVVPGQVSWKWDVRERGGLARLDYTQNTSNKTLVAPYSPRAAPGRRCPRRSSGTSWRIRRCGRTGSRSGTCRAAGPDRRSLPHRAGPGPGASPDQLVTGQPVTGQPVTHQPVTVPDPVAIAKMCMAFTPFPAPLLTVGRVTDATVLPLSSGTAA